MEQTHNFPKKKNKIARKFSAFAEAINAVVGSPYWFIFSLIMVVVWFFSGFFIGFGDSWQLIINTTTTVMTFLMISLLHSSQKKWEDKIERMQNQEVSHMKEIKKETKKIAMDSQQKPEGVTSGPEII